MKKAIFSSIALASTGVAVADLYYIPGETQESIPLRWVVGADLVYDDNVTPTVPQGTPGFEDEAISINPYVGLTFVSISPQSTLDVYARVGANYYFDSPEASGTEDIYAQIRTGVNYTHRFSERLRFSSRNYISYDLEPDYANGLVTTRQIGEYLTFSTDNAIGYRWTERFATYTGFKIDVLDYGSEVANQDRFTTTLYNDFRYQLSPQTVLTAHYRYATTEADGLAQDSEDHYFLAGIEHRVSPNTILIARAGVQVRETDAAGSSETSPFVEGAFRSQVNEQFSIRGFIRYSMENTDTVRTVPAGTFDFEARKTLRIGLNSEYSLSPRLSLFGGVDYIPSQFDAGRNVVTGVGGFDGPEENLLNAYVGASFEIVEDRVFGTVSYNFTDSDSDFINQDYQRNRVSVGVRAEF